MSVMPFTTTPMTTISKIMEISISMAEKPCWPFPTGELLFIFVCIGIFRLVNGSQVYRYHEMQTADLCRSQWAGRNNGQAAVGANLDHIPADVVIRLCPVCATDDVVDHVVLRNLCRRLIYPINSSVGAGTYHPAPRTYGLY